MVETAHNAVGIKTLVKQIGLETYKELHIIIGIMTDKDVEEVLKLLPKYAHYYISKANVSRGMEVEVLASHFLQQKLNFKKYSSISKALKNAKKLAHKDDLLIVTGSVFVVAEVI